MTAAIALTASPRRLSELLMGRVRVNVAQDVEVSGLALDSRDVGPGMLFAALSGTRGHGLEHLAQALEQGAAAVAWEPSAGVDPVLAERQCAERGVPLIAVEHLSSRLSEMAGRFYDLPSRYLRLVGVTGTDGKTSVSQFLAQALSRPGRPCGVLGTLGYGLYGKLAPASHTTPDAIRVQRLLAEQRAAGARFAAMEVSSHALAQGRVAALDFDVAVLTNLTRDHLDYHGSDAAYAAAKTRLFQMPGLRHAVLNQDDPFGRRLADEIDPDVRLWRYSLRPDAEAEVVCKALECEPEGLRLRYATPVGEFQMTLPLFGRFNAANVAAVLASLLALGLDHEAAAQAMQELRPVPGRMERFSAPGAPTVLVDYAHTPAALAAALDAVRAHSTGRVWCVFGCGGDRDAGKRPLMGRAAVEGADRVLITDDNPRSEAPESIVADIRRGLSGAEAHVIHDRTEAIRYAVAHADANDTVLIAGKGHETYQIVGAQCLPFDDREAVRAALQERN